MQNEALSDSAYGNVHGGAGTKSQNDQDGDVFASLYSSLVMAPETTTNTTLSHSPHNPFADPSTLHDSRFYSRLLIRQQEQQHQQRQRQRQQQQQQHQDMINRHNLCLTRLREAAREAESLRHENASLRSVNLELNKHISLLIKSSVNEQFSSTNGDGTSSFGLANAMRGLSVGGVGGGGEEACVESPTSVMENVEVKRISLPKSISVRSNGYLKMGQGQGQAAASSAAPAAANKPRPRTAMPLKPTQKVYVKGGKQEEEPLELEVYNQGMFKTELCNKWQETGACPYGDQCQFAHGIEELRPVIRHPRYKTEVCRMVLAGDICPYGHRCHFRHALTEQERFMGHLNPRSIKLN